MQECEENSTMHRTSLLSRDGCTLRSDYERRQSNSIYNKSGRKLRLWSTFVRVFSFFLFSLFSSVCLSSRFSLLSSLFSFLLSLSLFSLLASLFSLLSSRFSLLASLFSLLSSRCSLLAARCSLLFLTLYLYLSPLLPPSPHPP